MLKVQDFIDNEELFLKEIDEGRNILPDHVMKIGLEQHPWTVQFYHDLPEHLIEIAITKSAWVIEYLIQNGYDIPDRLLKIAIDQHYWVFVFIENPSQEIIDYHKERSNPS